MPLYMPASSAPPTTYLFIDGGSLRGRIQNISKSVFNGRVLKIDFQKIAHLATKTFYYDAIPTRKPTEADNEFDQRLNAAKALLDEAASVDGIHVYEGETRYRRKRGNEQKKVDVMLQLI